MQEKQRTVPAPDLKEHFMISSTQHLNIYSSLKIYLSKTNAQRVYSMCGKVRWRVVAHYNHVQVSPAYLCIHTRPVPHHKQYTPAFHPCTVTLPRQGHVPANSSYRTRNNSLPVSLSPPHTSVEKADSTELLPRSNYTDDQLTPLHWWGGTSAVKFYTSCLLALGCFSLRLMSTKCQILKANKISLI